MNKILVPTDLSQVSQNATNYAANLCRELGAKMILLHVYMLPVPVSEIPYIMVTADEMQKASEEGLKKEADRIFDTVGIEVEWIVRLGLASDEIREIEKERNIDLVVMGSQGAGELDKLMGSTTTAVIRKCRKAVLVVPLEAQFAPLKSVSYATDFSYQMNLECFEPLKLLIRHFNAGLLIVHVHKEGKVLTPEQISGKVRLEPVLDSFLHSYHNVEAKDIEHGLQRFIEEQSPDMLAMVAHKHNFLERLFGAHHTTSMLYQTHIPLLVLQDKS